MSNLDSNTIILFIQIALCIIFYIASKYTSENLTADKINQITGKFNIIVNYAEAFVVWARQFMDNNTGSEKMNAVIEKLKDIAIRYDIDMTEDEIKAIVQKAYEAMIAEEKNIIVVD